MTINLTPDHFAYFPSKCGLVDEDFPTPVIQLEIQGNIPWVLNEPNPYFYPVPLPTYGKNEGTRYEALKR